MSGESLGQLNLALMQEGFCRAAGSLTVQPTCIVNVAGHSLFADDTANRLSTLRRSKA